VVRAADASNAWRLAAPEIEHAVATEAEKPLKEPATILPNSLAQCRALAAKRDC
jgi:hypothetical protein